MLKSNIDVFFVMSFLCSLKFLLFHRIEYHMGECMCVYIYICISVPFVCEVDLENKYSILLLFYSGAYCGPTWTGMRPDKNCR